MANIPEEAKLMKLYEKEVDELTDEEVVKVLEFVSSVVDDMGIMVQGDFLATGAFIRVLFKVLIERFDDLSEESLDAAFRRELLTTKKQLLMHAKTEAVKQRILQGVQLQMPPNIPGIS